MKFGALFYFRFRFSNQCPRDANQYLTPTASDVPQAFNRSSRGVVGSAAL